MAGGWTLLGGTLARLKGAIVRCAKWIIAPVAFATLAAVCLYARRDAEARLRAKVQPRLVYGPVPIISIKYMRHAMEKRGFEARTFVYEVYAIHSLEDYDYCLHTFFRNALISKDGFLRSAFFALCADYAVFLWLLSRFDIYHFFFDGGFLARTPLRFVELQLLRLAGKRIIVMPYGSDVMHLVHFRSLVFRHNVLAQYPDTGRRQDLIARQISYFSRHATFVIGVGWLIDTMPRWDLLATNYFPIDTDAWVCAQPATESDGRADEVVVFHSPNHRWLKGTKYFIEACDELRREGYKVRLIVAERMPNNEVRRMMARADILAEQCGMPWYGLNAMEGMSLGKPVLSDLSDRFYTEVFRRYTGLDECPIVSANVETLKERLRTLIENPQLRREIGEASRRYVVKYHSYEAMGRMWEAIYRKVWNGESIDLAVWHPDREWSGSCNLANRCTDRNA
jgi:glycosyltransferase involved in cell wall biosynthesis